MGGPIAHRGTIINRMRLSGSTPAQPRIPGTVDRGCGTTRPAPADKFRLRKLRPSRTHIAMILAAEKSELILIVVLAQRSFGWFSTSPLVPRVVCGDRQADQPGRRERNSLARRGNIYVAVRGWGGVACVWIRRAARRAQRWQAWRWGVGMQ